MFDATSQSIPVVDLSSDTAADDLLNAAVTFGFIFVKHTDDMPLKPQDVDDMFSLSRDLFSLPPEVKAQTPITQNRGFVSMHREALDPKKHKNGDFKEAFNFGEFTLDGKAQQPLPELLETNEAQLATFSENCRGLCNVILRLLADAMRVGDEESGIEWFATRHDRNKGPTGSTLRLLHYPALPASTTNSNSPSTDIRAGAHTDYGSITLLFRLPGQPGLEVQDPDGDWVAVPVDPEATESPHASGSNSKAHLPILVNIGDLLSYWTNGLLRSTKHRVIFPVPSSNAAEAGSTPTERYSIAYFCHPLDEAKLEAVPSSIVREASERNLVMNEDGFEGGSEARRPVLTAKEHLMMRLEETYGGAT